MAVRFRPDSDDVVGGRLARVELSSERGTISWVSAGAILTTFKSFAIWKMDILTENL